MARTPKTRVNYAADRGFLIRLRQAVEKDARQPTPWKRDVAINLTRLEQLFLDADLRQ